MYITTYSCQCDECGRFESETFSSKSYDDMQEGIDEKGEYHHPIPFMWAVIHDKDFDPTVEYIYCLECFEKRTRGHMKEFEDMPETGEERNDDEKKKQYEHIVETQ